MKTFGSPRYSFTNHFEYTGLKGRIQMMNQARSDAGWWRYALLWALTILVIFACQKGRDETSEPVVRPSFPLTNPTRVLVDKIEDTPAWGRLLTYHQKRGKGKPEAVLQYGEPFVLSLKDNVLTLGDSYKLQTIVYLNGKEAAADLLAKLEMKYVEELFVLHQFEGMDYNDPKPYRVLIQLSDKPMTDLPGHQQLAALLRAAAVSEHPLGVSHTYTMNTVLEATFFGYRDVFVKRLKNQHLKLQDEFTKNIDVFINGIPVSPKEVETVHVREIDRLYTAERPFTEWMRPKNSKNRYILFIQTTPKRAQRDSSYYVFSPFYSGDF